MLGMPRCLSETRHGQDRPGGAGGEESEEERANARVSEATEGVACYAHLEFDRIRTSSALLW